MFNIALVIIGGGLGAACRYLLSIFAVKWFGSNFPLGTLGGRNIISPSFRLLFMTGFLGGLTTFSTYALESADLFRNTEITIALLNVVANNLVGMALVLFGLWLGKFL